MKKGVFIVFEGGEGSGKTSHSKAVAARLREAGHDVLHTAEPGGSEVCMKIRRLILDEQPEPIGSRAELLLFLADRAHHVEHVIRPALAAGKIVICDRFSGSTFAYQIGGRELPDPDSIIAMDAYARGGLIPDAVLYLDVSVETGIARRMSDTTAEVNRLDNEKFDFHNRVRDYFLKLSAEQSYWQCISTEGERAENEEKIFASVQKLLDL